MARKSRVYAAEVDGVHEWVVAAPNQRAALEALGINQDLFAQGRARPAEDPAAIEAALAEPGVPLRRLAGSGEPFRAMEDDAVGGWAAALAAAPRPGPATKGKAAAPIRASKEKKPSERPGRNPAPPRRKAPDRRPLIKAEAELSAFAREEVTALGEIARERAQLERREARLRADLAKRREALQRAVERARRAFEGPN